MDINKIFVQTNRRYIHPNAEKSAEHLLENPHDKQGTVYGSNPRLSTIIRTRRLALAGHVARHNEPAGKVLLWKPAASRRVGRPNTTLKKVLEEDTGLEGNELRTAMLDRVGWRKNYVMAPTGIGWR